MYFFTADEHYWHKNIIEYFNRPFHSVEEMNEALITKHNEVVSERDSVVHVRDFALCSSQQAGGHHPEIEGTSFLPERGP